MSQQAQVRAINQFQKPDAATPAGDLPGATPTTIQEESDEDEEVTMATINNIVIVAIATINNIAIVTITNIAIVVVKHHSFI